mmetsp:Transcript_63374/g.185285  ORF Transcript_63374/g.185285 Transcript_63374/m.185285 type:complete len:98 (-) Transcript_63374:86-379(-)
MGCFASVLTPGMIRSASDKTFTKFDKDGSGALHPDELKQALSETVGGLASSLPLDSALQAVDEDGSGDLDPDEFYKLVLKALRKAGANIEEAEVTPE